jgi:hypothetical protein
MANKQQTIGKTEDYLPHISRIGHKVWVKGAHVSGTPHLTYHTASSYPPCHQNVASETSKPAHMKRLTVLDS